MGRSIARGEFVEALRRYRHQAVVTATAQVLESRATGCLLLAFVLTSIGCTSALQTMETARDAYAAGDLTVAREVLLPISESGNRFSDVASLDLAMIELASGRISAAEQRLREMRDRFDEDAKLAPLQEAASMVSDDTARQFRPAGYEEVMIRTMLAISSIATDGVDAEAYALQATVKQAELAREAEQRGVVAAADVYQPIAVAPYLRGMLREANHHDYDDATRAYQLVSSVQPQFAPASADIKRASVGVHSAPGHGVLYVIACVGRGPVLEPTEAKTTSTALSIASSVLNAETNKGKDGKADFVLPNVASVKVPRVVVPPVGIDSIGVRVNSNLLGATQTLTDVGQLAQRQVEAEMPWTIARAVLRRTTKELAVTKATESLGLDGAAGSLFHFAAASGWAGVEQADTRCWGLLPREIQVFRGELPVGEHQVALEPFGNGNAIGPASLTEVDIVNGRNCYLLVFCPSEQQLHVVSGTQH